MEPWDMDNRKAIADGGYKAPPILLRKGRFLSNQEIIAKVQGGRR